MTKCKYSVCMEGKQMGVLGRCPLLELFAYESIHNWRFDCIYILYYSKFELTLCLFPFFAKLKLWWYRSAVLAHAYANFPLSVCTCIVKVHMTPLEIHSHPKEKTLLSTSVKKEIDFKLYFLSYGQYTFSVALRPRQHVKYSFEFVGMWSMHTYE